MKHISNLTESLKGNLGWNKARMTCFVAMLLGLFAVRTVNLKQISLAFDSKASCDSRYRRLQRFFAFFNMDFTQLARWIFLLMIPKEAQFYIAIDRTNWFWGKNKINVFMLSLTYEGIAIPLFWTLLPKAGNSNIHEQKQLIKSFLDTFGRAQIKGLLADREFASGGLFNWLNSKKIPFFIRVKEGSQILIKKKKFLNAKKIFSSLQPKTKKIYAMTVWLYGQKVFLAGSRSERGELMIVATNQDPRVAIASYLRRWEIENLFQALKSRGFHFEDTHITEPERIKKLMAVLAIGFVWAHKIGEWKAEIKPIIWKNLKNQKRPQYSYFRYGLDVIREAMLSITKSYKLIKKYFSFLILDEVYGL